MGSQMLTPTCCPGGARQCQQRHPPGEDCFTLVCSCGDQGSQPWWPKASCKKTVACGMSAREDVGSSPPGPTVTAGKGTQGGSRVSHRSTPVHKASEGSTGGRGGRGGLAPPHCTHHRGVRQGRRRYGMGGSKSGRRGSNTPGRESYLCHSSGAGSWTNYLASRVSLHL